MLTIKPAPKRALDFNFDWSISCEEVIHKGRALLLCPECASATQLYIFSRTRWNETRMDDEAYCSLDCRDRAHGLKARRA